MQEMNHENTQVDQSADNRNPDYKPKLKNKSFVQKKEPSKKLFQKKAASGEKGKKEKSKDNTPTKEVLEWVASILIAVVVALLLKSYVLTLVKVDGASMEPSLQNGDRLYVNRLFYSPEKGDIVIFQSEATNGDPYVKRVIATEGDTVYIDFQTGNVFVNGLLLDEPYINEPTLRGDGNYIQMLVAKGDYSPEEPILLGDGEVFVLGDNRNRSTDSRELGPISEDDILGEAVFRFWPFRSFGALHQEAAGYGE